MLRKVLVYSSQPDRPRSNYMHSRPPTSRKAMVAFLLGVTAIACGFLAIAGQSDLLLLGVAGCGISALSLGIVALQDVRRNPGALRGAPLAAWGIGLPVAGIGIGFILLPAT
jgi:hypothetical protein